MIDRRALVGLALAALAAAWLHRSSAQADPAFKRFLPLLVDLDGWQGKKTGDGHDGREHDHRDVATISGAARLHASVMIGPAAAGALGAVVAGINIETADGHMISSTLNGLKTTRSYNSKDKSGAVLVALGESALFSVSYNGLTEGEALPLTQKFAWKAIQAMAAELK